MKDLIAALEAATEGSRKLSDDVLLACGWIVSRPKNCGSRDQSGDCFGCGNKTSGKICVVAREYWNWAPKIRPDVTRSLDAALTLVPAGWGWAIMSAGHAEVYPPDFSPLDNPNAVFRQAATPALALCIAALRARQAMEGS